VAEKPRELNERQKQFVREYLVDLNATQAAIRAGYSPKTAYAIADKLLKKAEIQTIVQKAMDARADRVNVRADDVLRELARIGFADLRKAVTWSGGSVNLVPSESLDDDTAAAVSEVRQTADGVAIKLHSKPDALQQMGRHLGMFKDKVELSTDPDQPFEITNLTPKQAMERYRERLAHGKL
jgi:phage terminase small subunit